ncbi:phytanoyl-CoA dioxygenase family protein [uncultured Microbulbifer sp.]|uniref:phytanoyl-CoA dioxygenase family protein n=1 Tax=uncultured Microbulbifer sp. TaxID=348147 RepID=UPI002638C5A0|nr:phytanoyl-CoA dioxygenase family protein [uncultured Microbulbifer sp.]
METPVQKKPHSESYRWQSQSYDLPESAAKCFARDGHITLRGVASASEVAEQRQVVADAIARTEHTTLPMAQRDTYQKAFLKHMNLWSRDLEVRKYICAQRYGEIAARLMGVDGVRIYHDQALYKEPGGGHTPWHQDQHYWPVDTDNTITMWMPMVDLDPSMGILQFASGSHRDGYLGDQPISDDSEAAFSSYVQDRGYRVSCDTALSAGDATFHAGWTLHSAGANSSPRMREVMTVIWVADGCRVSEPQNFNQHRDLQRWMPGLVAGDKVASTLNPLVYHRDSRLTAGR